MNRHYNYTYLPRSSLHYLAASYTFERFPLDWISTMLHYQSNDVDQFVKTWMAGTWNIYLLSCGMNC